MTCPLCNGNRLWWRWIRRHFNCLDCGASFPKFATLFVSNATFEAALDNPPEPNETLKDLMAGDVRESLAVRIDARLTPDRVTPLVEALRRIANWRKNSGSYTDSMNLPRRKMDEAQVIHIENEAKSALRDGGFDDA